MSNLPIKASSKEFTNEPFHVVQSNGADKRYVVSLRDKESIRTLFADFINQSDYDVQIKIRDLDDADSPIDYLGSVDKSRLHKLITKHEDVIFHHGYHDLMLRHPDTGDYIVFDEHGLIFIYTNQDYSSILAGLKAPYKPNEKLIYEYNHWHYCLANGQERLNEMIRDFKLNET